MDIFQAIVKEMDEKIDQLKDYLSSGRTKDFEEYKQLCGQISGLLYAKDYALSLKQKWESSDD